MPETLEQTAERYLLRWRPTLRPASISTKQDAIKNFIRYLQAHHPDINHFSQVSRHHVEGWLEHLLYLKPISRITVIRNLRLFFDDLLAWGWLLGSTNHLLSNEDLPPEPLALPKPLPPELDQAFQETLRQTDSFPAKALLLLRLTGMRLGEMRALSVHALEGPDPDGHYSLRVPVGKTYSERIIPLGPEAVQLVKDIAALRGAERPVPERYAQYLMVNELGRHLKQQGYDYHIKRLTAELDSTERIYPHRLRHTFATEMSRAGMPVPALMKILGHRTPKMTMRYVEVAHADLRQAYGNALGKLKSIDQFQPLEIPAPTALQIEDSDPYDQVFGLFDALIRRLESMRRDESAEDRAELLHRMLFRIRRARNELKTAI